MKDDDYGIDEVGYDENDPYHREVKARCEEMKKRGIAYSLNYRWGGIYAPPITREQWEDFVRASDRMQKRMRKNAAIRIAERKIREDVDVWREIAGVEFPLELGRFFYNQRECIGDARINTTHLDGVEIYTPDTYFTFNPDGSRPDDILFVFTPGEHVPDWEYSKDALLLATQNNPNGIVIDGGCGTGVKACLLGKTLDDNDLDNNILLVDPNPRAITTTMANVKRNNLQDRFRIHHGTLNSAVGKYRDEEIAGAYINPPYQARPDNVPLALHCDGGEDGLKITRELLRDLLPYLADRGTIAVHTKSPAYADKSGFKTFPLILEDLIEGRIIPKDQMRGFEIRFSRTCDPMDLYDFYRLVYRERENDFAQQLAARYPLIDMTLLLITRKKGQQEINVIEDPKPYNPEGVVWGVKDGKLVEPGHVLWHKLFVPRE